MSNLVKQLEIFPPVLTPFTKNGEVFTSTGHRCPYCNGAGSFSSEKGYHGSAADELEEKECPICKGKGQLQAKVVIGWQPDESVKGKVL